MRARLPMDVVRPTAGSFPRWTSLAVAVGLTALASACGGDDGDTSLPAVDGPTSPQLEVRAGEMAYEPDAVAVEAGEVDVVLHNEGSMLHDLRIEDEPLVVEATPGETGTGQVELEPGSYQFFCSISGHREAGMEGVLEVR